IEDELEGHGFHDFELNVQLAPNRRVEIIGAEKGILCRIPGDRPIQLFVAGPLHLQGATEPSLVSTTYGATVPAVKVRIWGRAEVPTCISTRISWADVADLTDGQFDSAKEAKGRGAVREAVC